MMRSKVHVVAAVIRDRGVVLVCRRAPGRAAEGQWEFPGGKVEMNEEPISALRRELLEELNVRVLIRGLLDRSQTQVGNMVIDLATYDTVLVGSRPVKSTDHDRMAWLKTDELNDLEWAAPDLPAVAKLVQMNVHAPRREA